MKIRVEIPSAAPPRVIVDGQQLDCSDVELVMSKDGKPTEVKLALQGEITVVLGVDLDQDHVNR